MQTQSLSSYQSIKSLSLLRASLLRFPPFKSQTLKDSFLGRQHVWRFATHTFKIDPTSILTAPYATTVKLKILLLLYISPQVSLESCTGGPASNCTSHCFPGANDYINPSMHVGIFCVRVFI